MAGRITRLLGAGASHWPVSGQAWIAAIGLIGATIIARVLGPGLFGHYFLALTITSCVAIAVDLCVAQAILTRVPGYEQRFRSWRRLAVGLVTIAAGLTWVVSLVLFPDADLRLAWLVLCVSLPLSAASMIPRAFLVLGGQLRFVSVIDVVSILAANALSVGIVLAWPSVTAAALSPLVVAVVRFGALEVAFRTRGARPAAADGAPVGLRAGFAELWSAIGGIYVSQLSGFASRSGGNLIVSFILGPASLAFYSRAFSFLVGPLQQAQMALNPLMLRDATDARLAGDSGRFLSSVVPRMFAWMLPAAVAVGVVGPQLTEVLLGDGWSVTGDIMALSAGLAISMTVALPARWALLASRDRAKLRVDAVLQFSLLAGCAIGALAWGVTGAMAVNAWVVGPVIAIVEWALVGGPAFRYFLRRALPLAAVLGLVTLGAAHLAILPATGALAITALGLGAGVLCTVAAAVLVPRLAHSPAGAPTPGATATPAPKGSHD